MAGFYEAWLSGAGFGPNWMHDPVGNAYWGVVGVMLDQQVQRMQLGLRSRYPTDALAAGMSDALDQQGMDCLLPRGGTIPGATKELDASYAARLLTKWDTWAKAGTPLGLLTALKVAGFPVSSTAYYLQADGTLGTTPPATSGALTATISSGVALITMSSTAVGQTTWPGGSIPVTASAWVTGGAGSYVFGLDSGEAICLDRGYVGGGGSAYVYSDHGHVPAPQTITSTPKLFTFNIPVLATTGANVSDFLMLSMTARGSDGAVLHIGYGGAQPLTVGTLFPPAGCMMGTHSGQAYRMDAAGNLIVSQPCGACVNRMNLHGVVPSPALRGFTLDARDQFFSHFFLIFLQDVTGLDNTTGNLVKACLNQTVARWRCAGAIYGGAAIVPSGAKVWGWPSTTTWGAGSLMWGTNGATWIAPE